MQKTAQESAQDSQPLRSLLLTHKDFCKTATQKVVFRSDRPQKKQDLHRLRQEQPFQTVNASVVLFFL